MTSKSKEIRVTPEGSLEVLSQLEVLALRDSSTSGLQELFRSCALAVLNSGSLTDDAVQVFEQYKDFAIELVQQDRGIKLEVRNAPATAFVDGRMIRGIQEHLFAVLRDIIYTRNEIYDSGTFNLEEPEHITSAVFHILRNARMLIPNREPRMVVCWGGHAIGREEYDYTKKVGYELGLRGLDVCTGCGPGAMKGPMKGATIGHSKQRIKDGRYLGISEPGIIAAESPNPIVNGLVIMPDIEKRLEAFVRVAHGIIVFPGGAGTAEEILYLLGILLNPANREMPFPVVLTGPEKSADYFRQIDGFIKATLGEEAGDLYQIIVGDPPAVAKRMRRGMQKVRKYRIAGKDAFYFNWLLRIEKEFQMPFEPTHENMRSLALNRDQPPHILAANLRRAFSGIVAGNVKEPGIRSIEKHGPFEINGDAEIMSRLDDLLGAFVADNRMKLHGQDYTPCYRLVL
ncbi:MAG: LOG family protein [Gammaproteobacteria bacterium]|nr:LOG family protein [Gammaproteobacteria bacterium]